MAWPPDLFHVGDAVRAMRRRLGFKRQTDLAEHAGLDAATINAFENTPERSKLETRQRLADALGLTLADLSATLIVTAQIPQRGVLAGSDTDTLRPIRKEREEPRTPVQPQEPAQAQSEDTSTISPGEGVTVENAELIRVVQRFLKSAEAMELWRDRALMEATRIRDQIEGGDRFQGADAEPGTG